MSGLVEDIRLQRFVKEALEFSYDGKEPFSLRTSVQMLRNSIIYTSFSSAAQPLFKWIGFLTGIIYFCPTLSAPRELLLIPHSVQLFTCTVCHELQSPHTVFPLMTVSSLPDALLRQQ